MITINERTMSCLRTSKRDFGSDYFVDQGSIMSTSTYRPAPSLTHPQTHLQPVTALSFDPVSDILWAGSNTGNVVALYSPRGMRGVCFPVGGNLAVKKIAAGEQYVRAVGVASTGVGQWAKGGMNQWNCG